MNAEPQISPSPATHVSGGSPMNATRRLHDLGQSIWLDNITRDMLNGGVLKGYIDKLSVTGLTSNPTIFDQAIRKSATYDAEIASHASSQSEEDVFFGLPEEDRRVGGQPGHGKFID